MTALGFASVLTIIRDVSTREEGRQWWSFSRSLRPPSAGIGLSWCAEVGKSQAYVNQTRGLAKATAKLFITGWWVTVTDGVGLGLALHQCKNHTSQRAE